MAFLSLPFCGQRRRSTNKPPAPHPQPEVTSIKLARQLAQSMSPWKVGNMRSYALTYTALIANLARNRLLVPKHGNSNDEVSPGRRQFLLGIGWCAYAFLAPSPFLDSANTEEGNYYRSPTAYSPPVLPADSPAVLETWGRKCTGLSHVYLRL